MDISILPGHKGPDAVFTNERIANFLYKHLEEFGDPQEDILACLDYVHQKGGFVTVGTVADEMVGVVVINETGMRRYIPENILVYIAVDGKFRGKGYGQDLMRAALQQAEGNVALHVEPHNPAKHLYEKLGFTNKYLEMRYEK
jgi:ribosomal protein S18 acetylase RimI-like enzyme